MDTKVKLPAVRVAVRLSATMLDKMCLYGAAGRARVVWVGRLDCRSAGPHHSTDRIKLYTGRASGPERVCGFHGTADTSWRDVPTHEYECDVQDRMPVVLHTY